MCDTPEMFALVPYDDGSTPRLMVKEGMVLDQPDDRGRTVEVHGVGGLVLVHACDIDVLMAALKVAKKHFDLEHGEA